MAENGAALQSYNNELVKCIEDLCSKRDEVSREIKMDEQEKEKLEHDIAILHERLQKVVTNLARKTQIRDEYGKWTFSREIFQAITLVMDGKVLSGMASPPKRNLTVGRSGSCSKNLTDRFSNFRSVTKNSEHEPDRPVVKFFFFFED